MLKRIIKEFHIGDEVPDGARFLGIVLKQHSLGDTYAVCLYEVCENVAMTEAQRQGQG